MEKKRSVTRFVLIFFIVFLGFFLRLYRLSEVPVALYLDEAAIGYNAYSIVQTGKDEYGIPWPIVFKSFNDYKLPGYIYSTALSVKFFGLNNFAVRLPSAIFGTLTILAFYYLAQELIGNKLLEIRNYKLEIASIAAAMLAVSPWHLQFSRAAFEANGSLFFVVSGFAFLLAARKNSKLFLLSGVSLSLSLYFYYTALVLVPIVVVVYILLFQKEVLKAKQWFLAGAIVGMLLLIPILPKLVGKNNTRIGQVSIFTDETTTNDYVLALARNPNSVWAKLAYNRRIGYVYRFVENYLKNNSLEFLFVRGDPYPRHHVSGMGYLYFWELPFLLTGIVTMFRRRTKADLFILLWWLLGAVPASLTTGSPQGLRTLTTLPAFILITVTGVIVVWEQVKKYRKLFTLGITACIVTGFFYYLVYYYDYTPRHTPNFWGDGHKQLFARLKELEPEYDNIVITGHNFKPYIYALYYLPIDPNMYQQVGTEHGFGKYIFTQAEWETKEYQPPIRKPGKTLFVNTPADKDSKTPIIEEIKGTFGDIIFVLQES